MNNCIAIITARGGSKRIPRKNIKNFLGHPIIKYPIDAALQAGCFDEVMVSTEDHEIAKVAESFGATIPFMRSYSTSDDLATTTEVLLEVVKEYQKQGKEFKYACCIYPTTPLITPKILQAALRKFMESRAESLIAVVRFGFPILRSFRIENNLLRMNWPEYIHMRSQDMPLAFHDCGQFYFFKVESFIKSKKLITDCTIAFELPESEVQDIDTEEDWRLAEMKYELLKKAKRNA